MAITAKQLADGQLPIATGDLYTSPALTTAYIKSIILVNTDIVARTINLYLLSVAGTARRIAPVNVNLAAGAMYQEDIPIVLDAGDKIQGDASVAAVVDYIICGAQEA